MTSVESEIEIRDWDGNVINVFRTKSGDGGFYYFSEEDDGLLLYGQDTEEQPKILKKESAEGKTLWETVLPKQMKDADQIELFESDFIQGNQDRGKRIRGNGGTGGGI